MSSTDSESEKTEVVLFEEDEEPSQSLPEDKVREGSVKSTPKAFPVRDRILKNTICYTFPTQF